MIIIETLAVGAGLLCLLCWFHVLVVSMLEVITN